MKSALVVNILIAKRECDGRSFSRPVRLVMVVAPAKASKSTLHQRRIRWRGEADVP